MNKVIKGKKQEVDELKDIEISQKFLEKYRKLVEKYHRDFSTQTIIVKVEKIK